MAIDEKHIGEDFYTIISNRDAGKIAMLCKSYNFTGLEQVLVSQPSVLSKVKSKLSDSTIFFKKKVVLFEFQITQIFSIFQNFV